MTSAADLIGLDAIRLLREHGFAVVHSQPSENMCKAGASLGKWHYHSPSAYWHRMVAESIRLQNEKPRM